MPFAFWWMHGWQRVAADNMVFTLRPFGHTSNFVNAGWPWYNFPNSGIVRFVQGGVVKTFRYVPLDSWIVDIASNDPCNFHKPIVSPKEYHVAAQVSRPDSFAQFWPFISDLGILCRETTFLAKAWKPTAVQHQVCRSQ